MTRLALASFVGGLVAGLGAQLWPFGALLILAGLVLVVAELRFFWRSE